MSESLTVMTRAALSQARAHQAAAHAAVAALVKRDGKIRPDLLDQHQLAAHGLAWCATYVRALEQLQAWATRLEAAGGFGPMESAILEVGFGEYLAQLDGGIGLSPGEIVRPTDLGLSGLGAGELRSGAAAELIASGRRAALRGEIATMAADGLESGAFGRNGLDDDTVDMLRNEIRRFVDKAVAPAAHGWHRADALIPSAIIDQLADLGVFGITIAEEHGGLGLGKLAMCVVTEELSRGYLGVGSLGTRAEIAGEMIASVGAPGQRARWLRAIASGKTLATAVFTEPDVGSDLGS
ncbi:MAG TPA: acyl-CoA dehydrogenase family protein, partial [Caulobacteraceae bacterium]|nr:acyl-CoA dehydrogenase family protein [Caulobacteraceae bacterium]